MNPRHALRARTAARNQAARTAAQADVLRRWATAGMERNNLTADQIARAALTLARAGLPLSVAERVVNEALKDAAAAFRAGLLRHGTELGSDSENTDTGRLHTV